MSAKEMFEQLGYECIRNDELIIYKKRIRGAEYNIYFKTKIKSVYKTTNGIWLEFTFKEILAINQQIKELSCNE